MPETDNTPTHHNQIKKDKMQLTVTDIYPAFQKKSKRETKWETASRLYQVFIKYV